jgi:hypothetical protein
VNWRITLAALLLCGHAFAQTDPETLLRQAYELRTAGNDEAALPLLEQAFATTPTPRIAAQLGLGEQALGRWESAETHLRLALSDSADPWVARHLEALQAARTIVASHLLPPAPVEAHRTTERVAPVQSTVRPQGARRWRVAGLFAIDVGGVFLVGGTIAWLSREIIVRSFNSHGCLVGDPMPQADCNASAAQSQRDAATALAVTGLAIGTALVVTGVALLWTHRETVPRRGFVACGPGPGVGAECAVVF